MSCRCAEHRQRPDVHRPRQEPTELREERLQVGHREVGVQRRPAGPVFVEHKDARIGGINVEIVVEAAGFGAGGGDLGHQQGFQFSAGFRAGGDGAGDSVHLRPFSG